jgi:hypothetical protein
MHGCLTGVRSPDSDPFRAVWRGFYEPRLFSPGLARVPGLRARRGLRAGRSVPRLAADQHCAGRTTHGPRKLMTRSQAEPCRGLVIGS